MEASKLSYQLDWEAGPSAQVDLFNNPDDTGAENYQLKYAPPLRTTVRSPVSEPRPLAKEERREIDETLERLAEDLPKLERIQRELKRKDLSDNERRALPEALDAADVQISQDLEYLGQLLFTAMLTVSAQVELRSQVPLFLEIAIDEKLLAYPWELMHDGQGHFCLNHRLGRLVNSTRPREWTNRSSFATAGAAFAGSAGRCASARPFVGSCGRADQTGQCPCRGSMPNDAQR